MEFKTLTLADKKLFDEFLKREEHELCVYAFENIYIWKGLFDIEWAVIGGCLCIFFKDRFGMFLYLPPLGSNNSIEAAREAFKIMDAFNKNKEVSRIENLEGPLMETYKINGYTCAPKSNDYVCLRQGISALRGNKFKSQRASRNYFLKHNEFNCLAFGMRHRDECLNLYDSWMGMRKEANADHIYQGMMLDSRNSLKSALVNYRGLDLKGMVVKVGSKIKGFTIGYGINKETFCILYEITDLSIKGLAQFIFAKFCQELKSYKYINIMDDSGLLNLKKVKLSYHPERLIPAYIAKKNDG